MKERYVRFSRCCFDCSARCRLSLSELLVTFRRPDQIGKVLLEIEASPAEKAKPRTENRDFDGTYYHTESRKMK